MSKRYEQTNITKSIRWECLCPVCKYLCSGFDNGNKFVCKHFDTIDSGFYWAQFYNNDESETE